MLLCLLLMCAPCASLLAPGLGSGTSALAAAFETLISGYGRPVYPPDVLQSLLLLQQQQASCSTAAAPQESKLDMLHQQCQQAQDWQQSAPVAPAGWQSPLQMQLPVRVGQSFPVPPPAPPPGPPPTLLPELCPSTAPLPASGCEFPPLAQFPLSTYCTNSLSSAAVQPPPLPSVPLGGLKTGAACAPPTTSGCAGNSCDMLALHHLDSLFANRNSISCFNVLDAALLDSRLLHGAMPAALNVSEGLVLP